MIPKRPATVRLGVGTVGRTLYLTQDMQVLRSQLDGGALSYDPARALIDNISTDEMTPGWVCFWYDENLGHHAFVGLRGGVMVKDSLWGKFKAIASGLSKGCGSSRETAPFAEKYAGVELVFAKTIEKIYGQNCQNIGLLASTDFALLQRLEAGEEVSLNEFTRGLDEVSCEIVEYGGLFQYNRARLAGETKPTLPATAASPMTLVEKIIARAAIADAKSGRLGVPAVKPGDALFCRTDVRFTHDYVTAMAASLFHDGFGRDAKVSDSASCYAFRDHLTFLKQVMPEAQKKQGLQILADGLADTQMDFCKEQNIRLYGEVDDSGSAGPAGSGGSEAICHNAVLEDLALPGQLIIGTDSHTCTAGALGCFAFGVGSTEMANAWLTKDVRVTVPQSVRYDIVGAKPTDIVAKDVMLFIMAHDYIKSGKAIGQVLEFGGPGLTPFGIDERATLTNMAVEAGATTGIIESDATTHAYLQAMRGAIGGVDLQSDPDAVYAARFTIDLSTIRPMVALPGDPRNGIDIDDLQAPVKIDIAYGGSCTGGKMADMDMYASVLGRALARGQKVKDGVELYIQFGSQKIRKYAEGKGYIALFERAGAKVINPSCGACIKAGPGVSSSKDQVTVSAINRNFPGRSGPGHVYLASPLVVAASAIAGTIQSPEQLFAE